MPTKKQQQRAQEIYQKLGRMYPGAKMALRYGSNFQMLVAVMLSAQCTDKKVNEVTRPLFTKYTSVDDFADANLATLKQEIKSTGFYNQKAKNVIATARRIRDDFGGRIPKDIDELVTLPGVARKTANIVLCNAYGINSGVAVDTHVRRLSQRFGFTKENDPVKIERDLMELFPKSQWCKLTYRLIEHGRAVCKAPKCLDESHCFHV